LNVTKFTKLFKCDQKLNVLLTLAFKAYFKKNVFNFAENKMNDGIISTFTKKLITEYI